MMPCPLLSACTLNKFHGSADTTALERLIPSKERQRQSASACNFYSNRRFVTSQQKVGVWRPLLIILGQ